MIELARHGKGQHREVMELPSLQKINPIFANVYLQLNCSGTDSSSPFQPCFLIVLIRLLLVILISLKSPLPLEDAALKLFFLNHLFMHSPLLQHESRSVGSLMQEWTSIIVQIRLKTAHCSVCAASALCHHIAL